MEYYPISNKVMQFTDQLQNAAPQMVQKQIVVNNQQEISFLVCNVYIHACITITISTITIYFIHPSGKLKLSFDRTMKNIFLNNYKS